MPDPTRSAAKNRREALRAADASPGEPPVAAPDHAEKIRLRLAALNAAANRYGADHELSAVCSHLHADLPALLAERQQHKDYLRDALHEMQLAQLDADNERRILGEVLAERQQLREALETLLKCARPSAIMATARPPACCPVCKGRGRVVRGFYDFTDSIPATGTGASETCRSCGGRGIV